MNIDPSRPPSLHARLLLLPALLLLGCPATGDDTGTPVVDVCDGSTVLLSDASNYAFQGALDVPSITTVSGGDVEVCWDQLTTDFQCQPVDPANDIDNVGLIRFANLSQDEVKAGLSENDLQQSEMSGYVEVRNDGATCTTLSAMSFFGTAIDLSQEFVEGGGTYMLLLTTGTSPGVGARMLTFLAPSAASDVSRADVSGGCGVLDFTVDLHSLTPVPACTDAPWTVDWSGVTVDGQGHSFDSSQVDSVMLGYYEGKTAADIEGDFLNLEQSATALYAVDVPGGTTADLAAATDGTNLFPGFTGDGLWVLALRCSRCYNPAPLFLTVVAPAAPVE